MYHQRYILQLARGLQRAQVSKWVDCQWLALPKAYIRSIRPLFWLQKAGINQRSSCAAGNSRPQHVSEESAYDIHGTTLSSHKIWKSPVPKEQQSATGIPTSSVITAGSAAAATQTVEPHEAFTTNLRKQGCARQLPESGRMALISGIRRDLHA